MVHETQDVRVDLTPGKEYWYTPVELDDNRNIVGRKRVGPYKIIGLALATHSGQHLVVYAIPTGRLKATPLADFSRNFEPVLVEEVPVPEVPEKPAGVVSTGGGW